MNHTTQTINGKECDCYVVETGPFNLVFILTKNGLIGCGAFDVKALEKFDYPAVKIAGVATIEDLLEGRVIEVNDPATTRGVLEGMSGRDTLDFL